MQKINNIILNVAIILTAAIMPVSCLEKEDVAADTQSVMIEMSVSAGGQTKALSAEAEEAINSLRVYAFYGDKLAGYAVRQTTAIDTPFYMDLELPQEGTHNVEFCLIANEGEMAYENDPLQLPQKMTKAQLMEIKYTGLVHGKALPMYCNRTEAINVDLILDEPSAEEGHVGHPVLQQKIKFNLERSLAKLSLSAAKVHGASVTPAVLEVNLLAAGTREYSYLFPQTDDVLNAVVSRANDRILINAPVTVSKAVVKGSAEAADPANYTSVLNGVYLPEVAYGSFSWNTSSGNAREAVLHIKFSLGDSQDIRNGYVYLPRVERNNHINVCLLINAEGQITANYEVAEWEWDEDKMTDWFFDYPTHTYIWHSIPEKEDDIHQKPGKIATMSETQPFIGYFQMTYPSGDRWMPTLEGLNAPNCRIKVYNDRTDELVFSSDSPNQLSVSDDWFRIEVTPKTGYMDMNDVVNLAITYIPGGLTESEYLLINGSYGDFFWDGSTSENYVTITMVN